MSRGLWRRHKIHAAAALLTAGSVVSARAEGAIDQKYLEIGSVKIETRDINMGNVCVDCKVSEYTIKEWNQQQDLIAKRRVQTRRDFGMLSEEGAGSITFDQIINYGTKLWKLIEAGKPVSNFADAMANALPQSAENGNWMALENWQSPKGRIYTATYKNLYGAEVVRFEYRILFTPGGSYEGKGLYLSNVNVQAQNLSVSWGYNVDAKAKVVNVINTGSKASPVAGMEVLVDWRVKTVLKDMRSTTSFFMKGDGSFVDLNGE
ncbi:MAG TPA: hypothetical protein VM901_08185 [Bdellovibrionota bacterium]|nr:hypothetical protein [Bdellovibrionota bacterium]